MKLNRPLGKDDPAQVSVDYATERSNATPGRDFTPTSETLTFTKDGPTELSFDVETFDNTKFTGDKQIVIRLTDPVDVERGALFQGSVLIDDNDDFDPKLLDDFEQGAYLWSADSEVTLTATDVTKGDARPARIRTSTRRSWRSTPPSWPTSTCLGSTCVSGNGSSPCTCSARPLRRPPGGPHQGPVRRCCRDPHDRQGRTPKRHVADLNGDGLRDLLFHFRARETGYNCESTDLALTGAMKDGTPIIANGDPVALGRDFPSAQDWTEERRPELLVLRAPVPARPYGQSEGQPGPGSGPVRLEAGLGRRVRRARRNSAEPGQLVLRVGGPPRMARTAGATRSASTTPTIRPTRRPTATATSSSRSTRRTGRRSATTARASTSQHDSSRSTRPSSPTGGSSQGCRSRTAATDCGRPSGASAPTSPTIRGPAPARSTTWSTSAGSPTRSSARSRARLRRRCQLRRHLRLRQAGGKDYHTFAVEWEPNEIRWYVDDFLYHQADPTDIAPKSGSSRSRSSCC